MHFCIRGIIMIKAVLFDLDGTLADSLEDLADSTNYALKKAGFPTHETEEYKYFVGDGIPMLIERALPDGEKTAENKENCLEYFMSRYREHYFDKTRAYDGIIPLLKSLKKDGFKIAVISNKAQEMAEKVVKKLFGDIFDAVAGKREGYKTKPDPALTLQIIKELGVTPEVCALVGDSGMDMAAAANAGALGIGVLWGFRTKEELQKNGAGYIAEKPSEIYNIIREINNE